MNQKVKQVCGINHDYKLDRIAHGEHETGHTSCMKLCNYRYSSENSKNNCYKECNDLSGLITKINQKNNISHFNCK